MSWVYSRAIFKTLSEPLQLSTKLSNCSKLSLYLPGLARIVGMNSSSWLFFVLFRIVGWFSIFYCFFMGVGVGTEGASIHEVDSVSKAFRFGFIVRVEEAVDDVLGRLRVFAWLVCVFSLRL